MSNHSEFEYNTIHHAYYQPDTEPGPAHCSENKDMVESHGTHVTGIASGMNVGASKSVTIFDYRVCFWSKLQCRNGYGTIQCPGMLVFDALDLIKLRLLSNENIRIIINMSFGSKIVSSSGVINSIKYYFDRTLQQLNYLNAIIVASVRFIFMFIVYNNA